MTSVVPCETCGKPKWDGTGPEYPYTPRCLGHDGDRAARALIRVVSPVCGRLIRQAWWGGKHWKMPDMGSSDE